ncbi:hypothetical protein ACRC7T_14130 [Segnochrobactraceae bacterium EtOH-i3]
MTDGQDISAIFLAAEEAARLPPPVRECPTWECEICGRTAGGKWMGPVRDWPTPPLCRHCEIAWGRKVGPLGAMRDRRILRTIDALAEALAGESNAKIFSEQHRGYYHGCA